MEARSVFRVRDFPRLPKVSLLTILTLSGKPYVRPEGIMCMNRVMRYSAVYLCYAFCVLYCDVELRDRRVHLSCGTGGSH